MKGFYFEDEEAGELQEHPTEAEAMASAKETLACYRRDALRDGEWSSGVEGIHVGVVGADGKRRRTHAAKAVGNEGEGYDHEMAAVARAA